MKANHIHHRITVAIALSVMTVLGSSTRSADAQPITGYRIASRVYNDFSTTTLVINQTGGNPNNVTINESGYANDGMGGNSANKHLIIASSDGGVIDRIFDISESFRIFTDVNLTTTLNNPRKEAGFQIIGNPTGITSFIVNSDAGEIVAFGAGAPYFRFGFNGGGNGYTPGSTVTMGMQYLAGIGGAAGTLEYFFDRDGAAGPLPLQSSGPLAYSNLEGGPTDFIVTAYAQGGGSTFNPDSLSATFTNLTTTIVPEPAASTMMLLVAVGSIARRRHD